MIPALSASMFVLSLASVSSLSLSAQTGTCGTDRAVSTLAGAGLGGVVAAIPATIIHRHDQATSHRIVGVSITGGAIIGFLAANRDHPCLIRPDSSHVGDAVVPTRSGHAGRGAMAGIVVGGVLGALGGTLYNVGCVRDPCNATAVRVGVMLFSASEGALAGGLVGGLIGWAWPVRS
jgi:hypothetical protein